jgi:hypothetical protein
LAFHSSTYASAQSIQILRRQTEVKEAEIQDAGASQVRLEDLLQVLKDLERGWDWKVSPSFSRIRPSSRRNAGDRMLFMTGEAEWISERGEELVAQEPHGIQILAGLLQHRQRLYQDSFPPVSSVGTGGVRVE